jgi:hypothetical protein
LTEVAETGYRAVGYCWDDAAEWDDLVARAPMATFLHTRRFLAYHGDRFEDVSLLIRDERGRLVAVLPAAVDPAGSGRVTSHPGSTYGGIVHAGNVVGERALAVMRVALEHYDRLGFRCLRYKAVPHIYTRVPSHDDLYALFRRGATLYRCDLSCAIDLSHRRPLPTRRRRGLTKAEANGVAIIDGLPHVEEFWPLLEANLASRHGVSPTHTAAEILQLHSLFPDEISFVFAELESRIVAGVVLFRMATAIHMQYAAADPEGRRSSALDAVLEHCIVAARDEGRRYFAFGASTEQDGRHLNDGLHRYKCEFGGGGVVQQFFDVDTEAVPQ